jgi:hypothetical protein
MQLNFTVPVTVELTQVHLGAVGDEQDRSRGGTRPSSKALGRGS